jgi:hypothetical protein
MPSHAKFFPRYEFFPGYVSLIGMLVTLLAAYGLDRWLFRSMRLAMKTSNFVYLSVWTLGSGLALLAVWVVLGWLTLARSRRSLLVSLIFLIIGSLIYSYYYLQMFFVWLPYLFTEVRTPLSYSGLFIAFLGLLHLFLPIEISQRSSGEL